jgi:hypothetical protein
MNMPMSKNDPVINSPTERGLDPQEANNSTKACGTLKYAGNQPKADAVPMQNSEIAARRPDS